MIRKAIRRAVLVAGAAVLAGTAQAKPPEVGKPAPPFELTLIDKTKTTLADQRGNVVVLNFWATWCGPCKKELPLLDSYYRAARQYGLRVFAVTTEDSVPISQLKPLFNALAIQSARRIKGSAYAPISGAVPTNFVIDRAGIVRYAQAGAFDLDDLNAVLVPLLNEPAPPPVAAPVTTVATLAK